MRHCNGCTMCCTVFEVVTPAGERCTHDCGGGCLIYEDKPEVCSKFECAWLQGKIDEQYKPDVVGWFGKVHKCTGVDAIFAYGSGTEGQEDAAKPGTVIVSQGRDVYGRKEDIERYKQPMQTVAAIRDMLKRRKSVGDTTNGTYQCNS